MRKSLRYVGGLVFCNFYRLLRIFPNNDPILGFALPFGKRDKPWQAALFAALAMVSFDFITGMIGMWTIGTALSYGLITLLFGYYFKGQKTVGLKKYAGSSIVAVLLFDFLTGPVMSSALFRIPFEIAFLGQIPFTMMHLGSAVPLTIMIVTVVDPALRKQLFGLVAKAAQRLKMVSSLIQEL
ncbi:MAG: hypothetical protein CL943_04105 [Candidatus Diapherotrites archaeon]|uniref:QueT transporter family protein n=1 Tax=Candidatus Iainarchaeum sp. TaxID=3101447 RepID=A0A2D6M1Z1_9ARCH|nr:hypothetical protein [Candidatus Diapherotrites archaeon]|tara:strand:- start:528 stop:1076 length:549 start_codon:yes stop_codon:yes gene_type:complete